MEEEITEDDFKIFWREVFLHHITDQKLLSVKGLLIEETFILMQLAFYSRFVLWMFLTSLLGNSAQMVTCIQKLPSKNIWATSPVLKKTIYSLFGVH